MRVGNIYLTERTIEIDKLLKSFSALVLSDFGIRLNAFKKSRNLQSLVQLSEEIEQAEYVFLLGDILNSADDIHKPEVVDDIVKLINLFMNKKVIIGLGNHENMYGSRIHGWNEYPNDEFKRVISRYTDATVLDNDTFIDKDKNLALWGLTNSFNFYENKGEVSRHDLYISELAQLLKSKGYSSYEEYANVLLSHCPDELYETEYQKLFELTIGGHFHDGLLPAILRNLPGNRGLYVPLKGFFPQGVRGLISPNENPILVNGPVNAFSEYYFLSDCWGGTGELVNFKKTA